MSVSRSKKVRKMVEKVLKKEVVVLSGDDWSGLYVDGKLVYENHSIPLHELAKAIGFKLVHVEGEEEAWAAYGYQCPRQLAEFKQPKKRK